ncbi:helicase RepA family protein, partial [Pseudomonas sp. GP01-A4]|uniref:helicase RepA family protein n=1 Tax=Pseudomonas sp. GP01-A4 TaxID=2070571 RepID=UPI000CCB6CDB
IEDGRGASALISKARAARALNAMTADEAEKASIENRRIYFRTYDGKSSLAPPSDESTWFRLASIDLRNGTEKRSSDNVGAVEVWQWPN